MGRVPMTLKFGALVQAASSRSGCAMIVIDLFLSF
jgi:hypothetical protein